MVKVVLPNGIEVSGTAEQIKDTLTKLGYSGNDGIYYMSKSKGLLKISEMHTGHIRNAMLEIYREWSESLSKLSEKDLLTALSRGPVDNITFLAMLKEYANRVK